MNWLVTGGCGFIGSQVVERLVSEGDHAVRVVDDLSVGRREDLADVTNFVDIDSSGSEVADWVDGEVQFAELDVRDPDLMTVSEGADIIIHLAAQSGVAPSVENPRRDCYINVLGTLNCLEAARLGTASRFVFASSGAAVGEVEPPIHEEIVPHPASPYGASKACGEAYCECYFRTFGLETVALRFSNVYGPGSALKNSIVARFFRRALNGEPLEIYGDGGQTRDFIYVEDLVDAVWRAARIPGVGGDKFQIATNRETSVLEITDLIVQALSAVGIDGINVRHTEPRQGDVRENYADISRARDVLGWSPEIGLEEGLRRTLEWFRT